MRTIRKKHKKRGRVLFFTARPNVQLAFVGVLTIGFFILGGLLLWFTTLQIPSIDSFHNRRVAESTKIFDRTGKILLHDVHGEVRRSVVPLEEISRNVKNATIAIEDAEFYEHRGIKPTAIIRATLANIREGRFSQGGSTITQQVVKNTILTSEKTITRKVKEWIISLKLERVLSKDQILEIYLNETPYGGTVYGIEEASEYYLGKSASELSVAEAAYLAALPQAPTYYSPYGNHRDALEARKNLVLSKMLENGFLNESEYDAATTEEVVFIGRGDTGIKAPHFVFFVREYLEEKYGVHAVSEGGLRVVTSLDWELQEEAEKIVKEYALQNETKFNAENAGMVAIDPQTGEILVMVGSRDYFDENIDGKYNVAVASRQPGSSFKPFVYATALKKGYTPETVVFDVPTQFSTSCSPNDLSNTPPCYSPSNYDDDFRGPLSFRNALAQSVNVAAVKVLYLAGISDSIKTAVDMGITTLADAGRYGLTLVLGGGEVRLLDMVSAYGVFAAEGIRHPAQAILRVEDKDGNVLEEKSERPVRALDTNIARLVTDILSDNEARTPLYGSNSPLYFGGVDVAAKTGTTNDYKDAWIVGYTPKLAVGAWAGNNIPESMNQISGLIVTPMWRAFMDYALVKYPGGSFTPPDPTPEDVPPILRGVWTPIAGGEVHSILYWIDPDNPRGGPPRNPSRDSQFYSWEYGVSAWALSHGYGSFFLPLPQQTPVFPLLPPTQPTQQTSVSSPSFVITAPVDGTSLNRGDVLSISVLADSSVRYVSYYINNAFIGTSDKPPFSFSYVPTEGGFLTIKASSDTGLSNEVVLFVN